MSRICSRVFFVAVYFCFVSLQGVSSAISSGIPGFIPPQSLAPLVEHVYPGVVQVIVEAPEGTPSSQEGTSVGSGFLINTEGYIVTNRHVIANALGEGNVGKIRVYFHTDPETEYIATFIGSDEETDLAVLKIEANDLAPVAWGDSDIVRAGDWALAIGSPEARFIGTSTFGMISFVHRNMGGMFDDFLQTDAPINKGNSGGPLFNMFGQVIGINTLSVPNDDGLSFAISSNLAQRIIPQLIENGSVVRGWIGLTIKNLTEEDARSSGLSHTNGAFIIDMAPGGPAATAGLLANDIALSVNGATVSNIMEFMRMIAEFSPNTTISVLVWRNGEEKVFNVTLGLRTAESLSSSRSSEGTPEEDLLPDNQSGELNIPELGIRVASVESGGITILEIANGHPNSDKDLMVGDLLLGYSIHSIEINSPLELKDIASTAANNGKIGLLFDISRKGIRQFVSLALVPQNILE